MCPDPVAQPAEDLGAAALLRHSPRLAVGGRHHLQPGLVRRAVLGDGRGWTQNSLPREPAASRPFLGTMDFPLLARRVQSWRGFQCAGVVSRLIRNEFLMIDSDTMVRSHSSKRPRR